MKVELQVNKRVLMESFDWDNFSDKVISFGDNALDKTNKFLTNSGITNHVNKAFEKTADYIDGGKMADHTKAFTNAASSFGDSASKVASSIGNSASNAANSFSDSASNAATAVKTTLQQPSVNATNIDNNSIKANLGLALGAGGLAAGGYAAHKAHQR